MPWGGKGRGGFAKRRRDREPDDVDLARDYIEDAAIRVLFRDGPVLVASCSGRTRMYVLGHDLERGWWCSCLRDGVCPHLLALQWILGDVRADVPPYAADDVARARELAGRKRAGPRRDAAPAGEVAAGRATKTPATTQAGWLDRAIPTMKVARSRPRHRPERQR